MPYTEKEINNCGWLWKMSLMQSIDMIVRLKSEINITQAIQHNNIGQNSTHDGQVIAFTVNVWEVISKKKEEKCKCTSFIKWYLIRRVMKRARQKCSV